MRYRYKQFLFKSLLTISDVANTYYVLDTFTDTRRDLFGIEFMDYSEHDDIVNWLQDCTRYDSAFMDEIRSFYRKEGSPCFPLYRMDDHMVRAEVAKQFMLYQYPIVIEPIFEWPRLDTNTIDIIYAVRDGAPLSRLNESAAFGKAEDLFKQRFKIYTENAKKGKKEKTRPKSTQLELTRLLESRYPLKTDNLVAIPSNGWKNPDTLKCVLFNAVWIINQRIPDLIRWYTIDFLFKKLVEDFSKWLDTAWTRPEQMQDLLSAFSLDWFDKQFKRLPAIVENAVPTVVPKRPPNEILSEELVWIGIELYDEEGNPVKNERYELYKGYKKIASGTTDAHGMAKVVHLEKAQYDIRFPDIHKKEVWK